MITKAPFTPEQIKKINQQQKDWRFHPHTCNRQSPACEVYNNPGKEGVLIARKKGLVCPCGEYEQDWCRMAE